LLTSFEPYDPTDLAAPQRVPGPAAPPAGDDLEGAAPAAQSRTGDCGDFAAHCRSGYTFPRGGSQVRSTADQTEPAHAWVYLVYDPGKPGSEVPSGTSFGTIVSGDLPERYHRAVGRRSSRTSRARARPMSGGRSSGAG
jgi:hypothetical protein